MNDLYLKSGYLNVPWIEEVTDKNNISFIIIVGSRQIGKTYGVLKLMLDEDRRFILMRRTQTEVNFLTNIALNPFANLDPFVVIKKDSEFTARIDKESEESTSQIGMVTSLKGIAKIRGFNGRVFTDLVYDEFIPENHVVRIKDEGDAFINALITISGNRELEGEKPLKCWLLANANNINNPVLEKMNLQIKLNDMIRKHQEFSIMKDKGVMLINAVGEAVISKRKQTAIYKAIDTDSEVMKMAFGNEFAYNDSENVIKEDLKQFNPVLGVFSSFSLWKSKHDGHYHVYKSKQMPKVFNNNDRGRKELLKYIGNIKNLYYLNKITFYDLILKEKFKRFIDVN